MKQDLKDQLNDAAIAASNDRVRWSSSYSPALVLKRLECRGYRLECREFSFGRGEQAVRDAVLFLSRLTPPSAEPGGFRRPPGHAGQEVL